MSNKETQSSEENSEAADSDYDGGRSPPSTATSDGSGREFDVDTWVVTWKSCRRCVRLHRDVGPVVEEAVDWVFALIEVGIAAEPVTAGICLLLAVVWTATEHHLNEEY